MNGPAFPWCTARVCVVVVLAFVACRSRAAPMPSEASTSASPPVPSSSASGAPPAAFGDTPSADEEAAIVRSFCGYLRTTGGSSDRADVEKEMRDSCNRELVRALLDGAVHVSRAGWARCEAHLKALAGPLDHGIRHRYECRDLFAPRLGVGAACASELGCRRDLYCDDLETHSCVARVPRGAVCVQTLTGNPCVEGSYCSSSASGTPTRKTCVALPKDGEPCLGYCQGPAYCIGRTCRVRRGARGEGCQPGVDGCDTGLVCDLPTLVCVPRRPEGARCDDSSECASGACSTSLRTGTSTCR